jgi:hypothetical protein
MVEDCLVTLMASVRATRHVAYMLAHILRTVNRKPPRLNLSYAHPACARLASGHHPICAQYSAYDRRHTSIRVSFGVVEEAPATNVWPKANG